MRLSRFAAACLAAALAAPAAAQDDAPDPPRIDPAALEAARAMGERLRALDAFTIEATLSTEEVLESGETLLHLERLTADIDPPGGLRMELRSPGRERVFLYDGARAVLWGPITRYYTAVPFSGTLTALVQETARRYDYHVPLSDLFLWGTEAADLARVTQAQYVGADYLGGRVCDHYAFRQEGVDWQLWIDTAEAGLPCAYRITDLSDPARPSFAATLTIGTGAVFDDRRFTFAAPDDAVEIPFQAEARRETEE